MIQFAANDCVALLQDLEYLRGQMGRSAKANPQMQLTARQKTKITEAMYDLSRLCSDLEMTATKGRADFLAGRCASRHPEQCHCRVIESELHGLLNAFRNETEEKKFVYLESDKIKFLKRKHLFGKAVTKNFPTAKTEIENAGTCIAVGMTTAAVFHLMRAAEIAVRELARHLDVDGSKIQGGLDHADCGKLTGEIDKKLKQLRLEPRGTKRSDDLDFYGDLLGEFNAFKDLWRTPLVHMVKQANESEAMGVLIRVRSFMQRLATRIREGERGCDLS